MMGKSDTLEQNGSGRLVDKFLQLDLNILTYTLWSHENFSSTPTCRLINSSKNELGKVSKQILETINKRVVNALHINQWKDTAQVIRWFEKRLFLCTTRY